MKSHKDRRANSTTPRNGDNGWRRYSALYPWVAAVIIIAAISGATFQRVDAQNQHNKEQDIKLNIAQFERIELKIQTAVIKNDIKEAARQRREMATDIKEVLRRLPRLIRQ